MTQLGEIKTIEDLKAHIITLRFTLIYNEFSHKYFVDKIKKEGKSNEFLSQRLYILPEGNITFKDFVKSIEKKNLDGLKITIENASKTIVRNFFKECFRITESYCYDSKQQELLKTQIWYEFYRVVTNSLSHDFKFNFNKKDLKKLPITYKKYSIDNSNNSKRIEIQLKTLLELNNELIEFVMNDLK